MATFASVEHRAEMSPLLFLAQGDDDRIIG